MSDLPHDEWARAETPESAEWVSRAEAPKSPVLALVLQRHASAITSRLVLASVGRLISVGVAIYVSLLARLSVTQLLAAALVPTAVSSVWFIEGRRLAAQAAGLERTLARRIGGEKEDVFIESGYYFLRSTDWRIGYYEPLVWLWVNNALLVTTAVIHGVRS